MKSFALIAAFVATTGSAFAATEAQVESVLNLYAPSASAADVTKAEGNIILLIAHDGSTESEKRALIRAIVNG
ncbi:hypothetical protein [Pseudaestuariivita atlantica]|uniref:Uncharacterized protein n=1 Tax=Pseudaestuariivita atlantica TaxID=1317121 RepID=A0A0L1JJR6_9RHOB|nr:hypothetical protein [Pseudaestuariivita atlantica]KNG91991.1 hypothetical protein ATO11_19820 [Pseudaestuariivita atlantica]